MKARPLFGSSFFSSSWGVSESSCAAARFLRQLRQLVGLALAGAQLLADLPQPVQAFRNAQQGLALDSEDLVDAKVFPDARQVGPALFALISGGSQKAGVDGADRGAADDVEIGSNAAPLGQFFDYETQDTGFVGAARTPAREDDCSFDPVRGLRGLLASC